MASTYHNITPEEALILADQLAYYAGLVKNNPDPNAYAYTPAVALHQHRIPGTNGQPDQLVPLCIKFRIGRED